MKYYVYEHDNIKLEGFDPDSIWNFVSITVNEGSGYGDSATTHLSLKQTLAIYNFLGQLLAEVD